MFVGQSKSYPSIDIVTCYTELKLEGSRKVSLSLIGSY
jgi:hypothetical protein